MMALDDVIDTYCAAWNTSDAGERGRLLRVAWTDDCRYSDPMVSDLDRASAAKPTEWLRGRILVERGKLADLAGRRADAVSAYTSARAVCRTAADTLCEKEAGDYLRKPFSLGGR